MRTWRMGMSSYRRRDFLRFAGLSAGSALVAACGATGADPNGASGSGSDSSGSDAQRSSSSASSGSSGTASSSSSPTSSSTLSATMSQLQAYLAANAAANFDLPPIATAVPVVSWAGLLSQSQTAGTTLSGGAIVASSSPMLGGPVRDEYSASLPGSPTVNGYPCLAVYRPYSCKGMARSTTSPTILRLKTDAPAVEITGVAADGSALGAIQSLIVDGQLVPSTALSSSIGEGGGWDAGTVVIDFGSRAVRDIWLQTGLNVAYIKVGSDDTIFPVNDQAEPQLTVVGDSYLQVESATFGPGALALEIGARLGIRKVAVDAIGGTGYYNSGDDLGNLTDRLPGHAADGSTIYLIMAGLNDYGDVTGTPSQLVWPSRSAYESAVLGYLQGLRAAEPSALIVVTAPFCPIPPMSDSSYVANPATNTSGLGDFLYKAQVHKSSIQQVAGPWVYIDVLMGTGWLNSSGATGDVTNLQWFTGGTPGPGTTATYKPGNTNGGGGGGYGGIATIPILDGGRYAQAPDVVASGGSGTGLLLASTLDSGGAISAIYPFSEGYGYTSGSGQPSISLDPTYAIQPAVLGAPTLIVGINPDGEYPLPAFAPPGSAGDLNNIYIMLRSDLTHPSPVGASYLSSRLAQNIFEAVMAL